MLEPASIHFFVQNIPFVLQGKRKSKRWIGAVIQNENGKMGEISFIFCDDDYLVDINKKYLNHNTLTDIITFNTAEKPQVISGDIFISVERVRENAKQYHVSFVNELNRVMVHGILHLCGYNDKTKSEKKVMREKEDYYLSLYPGN